MIFQNSNLRIASSRSSLAGGNRRYHTTGLTHYSGSYSLSKDVSNNYQQHVPVEWALGKSLMMNLFQRESFITLASISTARFLGNPVATRILYGIPLSFSLLWSSTAWQKNHITSGESVCPRWKTLQWYAPHHTDRFWQATPKTVWTYVMFEI